MKNLQRNKKERKTSDRNETSGHGTLNLEKGTKLAPFPSF
jgi:hypothetical protein